MTFPVLKCVISADSVISNDTGTNDRKKWNDHARKTEAKINQGTENANRPLTKVTKKKKDTRNAMNETMSGGTRPRAKYARKVCPLGSCGMCRSHRDAIPGNPRRRATSATTPPKARRANASISVRKETSTMGTDLCGEGRAAHIRLVMKSRIGGPHCMAILKPVRSGTGGEGARLSSRVWLGNEGIDNVIRTEGGVLPRETYELLRLGARKGYGSKLRFGGNATEAG